MKKYSIKEIRNWLLSIDPEPWRNIEYLTRNISEEEIDKANSPSTKVKNAHNEMMEEDKEEDLDTFEEGGARVIIY